MCGNALKMPWVIGPNPRAGKCWMMASIAMLHSAPLKLRKKSRHKKTSHKQTARQYSQQRYPCRHARDVAIRCGSCEFNS